MVHQSQHPDDLLVSANFIRAVRESGYVSLATALAELIDNSLQAGATDISISISRSTPDSLPEIRVLDNGSGMSRFELEACLRFGGSSRFNDRDSFGRFGMGLPAASLSQARRIEVTSWQDHQPSDSVALDVDSIVAGAPVDLNAYQSIGAVSSQSGCLVRWENCDRIEYKRFAWLERALHRELGRIFRRFLQNDLTLTINNQPVKPVDPLMLATTIEGDSAHLAFDPLRFELESAPGSSSFVTVRFTILPVSSWHRLDNATKRRIGIVGGGGVSIMRAGREIANDWNLMGSKRKENYDDWWRCEIEFEPILDGHFGITINKQGIRPSQALREAIEPDLESTARLLNARVRLAFEEVKFQIASEASCKIAAAADHDLPVIHSHGSGPLNYRIGSKPMPIESMFRSTITHRTLDLTFNVDHPAFAALYQPLKSLESAAASDLRTSLELFLLSFARSAAQIEQSGQQIDKLLQVWSNTYGRMLQRS